MGPPDGGKDLKLCRTLKVSYFGIRTDVAILAHFFFP